jgi:hypothetical protein
MAVCSQCRCAAALGGVRVCWLPPDTDPLAFIMSFPDVFRFLDGPGRLRLAVRGERLRLGKLADAATRERASLVARIPRVDSEFSELEPAERKCVAEQMRAGCKALEDQAEALAARVDAIERFTANTEAFASSGAGQTAKTHAQWRVLAARAAMFEEDLASPVPVHRALVALDNLVLGHLPSTGVPVAWPTRRDYGDLLRRFYVDPWSFPVVLASAFLGGGALLLPRAAKCILFHPRRPDVREPDFRAPVRLLWPDGRQTTCVDEDGTALAERWCMTEGGDLAPRFAHGHRLNLERRKLTADGRAWDEDAQVLFSMGLDPMPPIRVPDMSGRWLLATGQSGSAWAAHGDIVVYIDAGGRTWRRFATLDAAEFRLTASVAEVTAENELVLLTPSMDGTCLVLEVFAPEHATEPRRVTLRAPLAVSDCLWARENVSTLPDGTLVVHAWRVPPLDAIGAGGSHTLHIWTVKWRAQRGPADDEDCDNCVTHLTTLARDHVHPSLVRDALGLTVMEVVPRADGHVLVSRRAMGERGDPSVHMLC